MKIPDNKVENRIGEYVRGGLESAPSAEISFQADIYKRNVAQKFSPILPDELTAWKEGKGTWHIGDKLYCSIKVDGQFALMYYNRDEKEGKSCFVSHSTHRSWMYLPVNKDLENIFARMSEKIVILAGELYAASVDPPDFDVRSRSFEFNHYSRNPDTPKDLERIGFRVYDLVQLDNENWLEKPYSERFARLQEIFPNSGRLATVTTKVLDSPELADFYAETVGSGQEGIVIRNSETFKAYKVKPIHSIDAVIIGAVEGIEGSRVGPGMLSSALVALQNPDGTYIILTKVGGGLSDPQRSDLWGKMRFANQPNFVAATTDGRSFRMVQPEIVVEIDYLDIITQSSQGLDITQTALSYNAETATWEILRSIPFVSLISPRFFSTHPIREDKTPTPENVRVTQVTELVDLTPQSSISKLLLPPSKMLARYVFAKGDDMVRKYMAWRTNKHEADMNFPDYVVYSLDYSQNRAEPFKRSIIVTNSQSQMWELFEQQVRGGIIGASGGITRGWTIFDQVDTRGTPMAFDAPAEQAGKKATKKAMKPLVKEEAIKPPKKSAKRPAKAIVTQPLAESEKTPGEATVKSPAKKVAKKIAKKTMKKA